MRNKFNWLVIFPIFVLLIVSCNDDWLLYRAGNDYFPLKNGTWWKYESDGVITNIEIQTDTVINNQPCSHWITNFADEYWSKDNGNIKKIILKTVNYNGTDYVLQQNWLLEYEIPFILGNYWTDTFNDTIVILGDTYRIYHTIWRNVVDIADTSVPAGTFFQTYKLEFSETFMLNDSTEQYSGYEWFAPGIGLIKRIINNSDEVLIDYLVK